MLTFEISHSSSVEKKTTEEILYDRKSHWSIKVQINSAIICHINNVEGHLITPIKLLIIIIIHINCSCTNTHNTQIIILYKYNYYVSFFFNSIIVHCTYNMSNKTQICIKKVLSRQQFVRTRIIRNMIFYIIIL